MYAVSDRERCVDVAINKEAAEAIAAGHFAHAGLTVEPGSVVELRNGWFFPLRSSSTIPVAGSHGVIVNKRSGAAFALGSAFPVERDLDFYDRGFETTHYDLVILEIHDLQATLDTLESIGPKIVELQYESDIVWRIPRRLSRDELSARLRSLPCVFGDVHLYLKLEELVAADDDKRFTYRAVPRSRPD
jgi:hypothetical protein